MKSRIFSFLSLEKVRFNEGTFQKEMRHAKEGCSPVESGDEKIEDKRQYAPREGFQLREL